MGKVLIALCTVFPVSYTHLDVYKRQGNSLCKIVETDCFTFFFHRNHPYAPPFFMKSSLSVESTFLRCL